MLQGYFATRAADSPLAPIVASCRSAITTLALSSGIINLLTLTGSIFMMQVYDRVLASQSMPTLVGLGLIAIAAYVFQGWLENLRQRILTLIGEKIDSDLSPRLHAAGLKMALASPLGTQDSAQSMRDVEAIRGFVTGQGVIAALDMPWVVIYIAFATLLHPWFGLTVVLAGVLLLWLTWKTEKASKEHSKAALEAGRDKLQIAEANTRGAETILGNGMRETRTGLWRAAQDRYLAAQRKATFVVGTYANIAKSVRYMLQSLVLALAAYLAIRGQITSGAIIAASIIVARALTPIDQAIASWRPFQAAREGHERLKKLLARMPAEREPFALAPPSRSFTVRDLAVAPPGTQQITMANVSFALQAGQTLGVYGPSGSGKSSLVKALVGAWRPARGSIAFDDTGPEQWSEDILGRSIGYMPQDVMLFEGTIAANIARFDADPSEAAILAAAEAAGLDQRIRAAYPKTGYDTPVGPGGGFLAGGIRQRVALARALYGDPFILLLDEPNSNLDHEGTKALAEAIRTVKARKGIVIIVTHRRDVLAEVDVLLTMHNGAAEFLGPTREVLRKWNEKHLGGEPGQPQRPPPGPRPVVVQREPEPPRPASTAGRPAQPAPRLPAPPVREQRPHVATVPAPAPGPAAEPAVAELPTVPAVATETVTTAPALTPEPTADHAAQVTASPTGEAQEAAPAPARMPEPAVPSHPQPSRQSWSSAPMRVTKPTGPTKT